VSLDQFIAERDALAVELGEEGEREQAAEVKRLRKPSVSAWAVNQASRRKPKQLRQLVEAGDALGRAQQSPADRDARERLRAAQRRERELVQELAREAERALRNAGRPVSAAVREQIEETLHAAALDPKVGEIVGRGRLDRPGVAVGFPGAGATPTGAAPGPDGKEKRKREGLEKRLRRDESRLAEATRKREAADAELREAERTAKEAAQQLDRASRRALAEEQRESKLAESVQQLREELEAGR
jgi:hypothetical protein